MRGFFTFVVFITVVLTACKSASLKQPTVGIFLSPLDKTHLKLEYQLPSSCNSLALLNPYGERTHLIRKEWKPLNECGVISDTGILTKSPSCTRVAFAIPIQAKVMDRVNPIAYPLDEQGVLAHTGTFAVSDTCGDMEWNFSSPGGAIIIDGTNRGTKTKLTQKENNFMHYTGVFLSYKPRRPFTALIANQKSPEWLSKGISDAAEQITDYYKKTYPKLNFLPPTLFVVNTIDPNSQGMQADVSHRMIRFGFFNFDQNSNAELLKSNAGFTAHEFAHLLQPGLDQPPFITEGGAEFARWMAQYKLGWRNLSYAAQEFSDVLSSCLQTAEDKSWTTLERDNLKGGYAVYSCGLAIHVIALASRQNKQSAEETLHIYYQTLAANHNADFAQAIECGSVENCHPIFLNALVTDSRSAAILIDEQLQRLGLIKNKNYPVDKLELSKKAFESLMTEDCGGVSFWTNTDHFFADQLPEGCKTFSNGMKISGVEGFSYFSEPLAAIEAQNKGCTSHGSVTLERQEEKHITVKCAKEFKLRKTAYEIDAEKLMSLLNEK